MVRCVVQRHSHVGDRISQLPVVILDHIMGFLPIQEAARTAVLSKVWRDVWFNLTRLCFDYRFFRHFKNKYRRASKYVQTSPSFYVINKVLLQHKGSIQKFVFDFSSACTIIVRSRLYDMDQWLRLVTHKGVEEIHLSFGHGDYKLPKCVLSSPTLKRLHVYAVCIEAQDSPCALPNVTSLDFNQAKFVPTNITNYAIDAPKLENISLMGCENISHFNITARNLRSLKVARSSSSKKDDFLPVHFDLRSIRTLELQDFWQQYLHGDYTLQLPALNVESLTFSRLYFQNDAATLAFVHLLSKCPKLCKLEISFTEGWSAPKHVDPTPEVLKNFRSVIQTHEMLLFLKLVDFEGSRSQMQFIKEMLACLPSLEEVVIVCHSSAFRCRTDYETLEEVLYFPRASTKAKIVYRNYPSNMNPVVHKRLSLLAALD